MSDIVIKSKDIDRSKFSDENLLSMRSKFPGLTDETLARFLLARNNDLEKAAEQCQKLVTWTENEYPVLKSSCLKEIKTGKLYMRGFDKEGRPLLIYRTRFSNPKERDIEEAARMLVFWGATVTKALPEDMTKYTLLVDRTSHKSENTDMELMKKSTGTFQDIFPERVKNTIIYPTDLLFYSVWNIAKWFLDPVTRNKVHPMMYLSGVEQYIDRKWIPKAMGGDDDYEFDPEDFPDPYPAEDIEKALAREAAAAGGGGEAAVTKLPGDSAPAAATTAAVDGGTVFTAAEETATAAKAASKDN
mmetsp:Transcript_9398/g.15466  ORF Transcript_9398/g.15466 Transcript_9398/m.15466 type:complete len:302 (-) Transcript_9398:643-1548(-)